MDSTQTIADTAASRIDDNQTLAWLRARLVKTPSASVPSDRAVRTRARLPPLDG